MTENLLRCDCIVIKLFVIWWVDVTYDILLLYLLIFADFLILLFCLLLNSFFFLFLENYGVRKLEGVFAVFIGTMAFSFAWMFFDTNPSEEELLMGRNLSHDTV